MRRLRPPTMLHDVTHFRAQYVTDSRHAYSSPVDSWRVAKRASSHYVEQGNEAKPSARTTHRPEPTHRAGNP
jgi:hypothetical protein